MKKLLFILALFSGASVFAQSSIPNSGFENWTNFGTYSDPDNWSTLNSFTSLIGVSTAEKGTPGHPGNAYLKLTSKSAGGQVIPGFATCGKIDTSSGGIKGIPFTQRPSYLNGDCQYMAGATTDSAVASVVFTKWDKANNMSMIVGQGDRVFSGMAMSWTTFSIKINYQDTASPDSMYIIFSSSSSSPVAGSYLYVDNLAFSTTTALNETTTSATSGLSVFPNPANSNFSISFNTTSNEQYQLQLLDLSGRVVKELGSGNMNGTFTRSFSAEGLEKGIYFIKLNSNNTSEVSKLVIQ
jgi:hypothetical protein